jgi:cell wall assembly regulator SMI1
MTVKWLDYIDPPIKEATLIDVTNLEAQLEVSLPQDYKDLILTNQGKCPDKEIIESSELSPVPFGPLLHIIEDCSKEQSLYGVLRKWNKWKDIYQKKIPIADCANSGCFFAYDFNAGSEDPPIVFVNVEEEPGDEDAILFVAKNISDLIDSLNY